MHIIRIHINKHHPFHCQQNREKQVLRHKENSKFQESIITMFSNARDDHVAASVLAGNHMQAWEKSLALRVSLQKPLDLAASLPVGDISLCSESLVNQLSKQLGTLSGVLEHEATRNGYKTKKRTASECDLQERDDIWENIQETQNFLQTERWEPVLNKWHARLNFGSEKTKAKLKVFTQTMWSQVENTLEDEQRSIAKSRMPWAESRRLGKDEELTSDAEEGGTEQRYDLEVFDDRMFYAMLLKTFITSASGSGNNGEGAGLGGTMRASDLEALRQYKRKKLNVERKASKGRKVRYNVHDKLQNFMFPVGVSAAEVGGIDADRLFQSLFQ